jgi:hypothetical protein
VIVLITNGSYYELLVITITNGFNDTGGGRGVGDWSIYSSVYPTPSSVDKQEKQQARHTQQA